MSVPVEFTGRCLDLSSGNGFQWEFSCGRCRGAYRSTFQQNYLSRGRGLLRKLDELIDGGVRSMSSAPEDFRGSGGDTAPATRDHAFQHAVDEVRNKFRHCPGCAGWVCLTCFDPRAGQCQECLPAVGEELARVRAEVRRHQPRDATAGQEPRAGLDVAGPARVVCPACGSPTAAGRFCGACGSTLDISAPCPGCARRVEAGAAFCSHCGNSR